MVKYFDFPFIYSSLGRSWEMLVCKMITVDSDMNPLERQWTQHLNETETLLIVIKLETSVPPDYFSSRRRLALSCLWPSPLAPLQMLITSSMRACVTTSYFLVLVYLRKTVVFGVDRRPTPCAESRPKRVLTGVHIHRSLVASAHY